MPTNDDLLFAEHAIKGGFVSREEADASLSVQRRMEEMGVRDTLRNVMVNRGVLREGDASLVAKAAGFAPGRDPIPGFTLESRIGTGAMGSVYKAWQRGMQRHVAVKILRRDLTSDVRQVERLRREAALVGKLDHPHIVRGLDSGESNGLVWFAMEFVDGETLRERIRRLGRVPPDDAVTLVRQLAEALEHAHRQGIVHRDIKPGNVLLTKEGDPRLSDYGLAKGQTDDALTQIDATLGTPQYVAPEQARNPRDADIRSDVYSLGATFYTMLCGRPPFEGETLAQTLTKVLYERPKPLKELVPELPDPVVYAVERMMAKDRRHRYPTPTALLTDLRALERGRLRVPAGFAGDIAVFVEKRRNRRVWAGGAAVVVGGVILAVAALWWQDRTDTLAREQDAHGMLDDIARIPGPEAGWDGHTVQEMIRRLEQFRAAFGGTAAAAEAAPQLDRWRHQEREIVRVRQLGVPGDADGDWHRRIAELAERRDALASDRDASIACRLAGETLAAVREQRDRRAQAEIEALHGAAAVSLGDARIAWTRLAETLRRRYFGTEPSPLVAKAEAVAASFEDVAARVTRALAPWEAAVVQGRALERGAYAEAADALRAVAEAIASDRDLRDALQSLPPAGAWGRTAEDRRSEFERRLRDSASQALESLRGEVERLLVGGAHGKALDRIAAFEPRALADQADAVAELRSRVESAVAAEKVRGQSATAATALLFFDAYGRFDVVGARQVLDAHEASIGAADAGARAFVASARNLVYLTETRLWDRVRAGIEAWATGGHDIAVRSTGIHYAGVTSVRVARSDFTFTFGSGQTWKGPLTDLVLDDALLAGVGVTLSDPENALVVAALRICQYHVDPRDPRRGLAPLEKLGQILRVAEAAPDSADVVARLSALLAARVRDTRAAIDVAEADARVQHERALADADAGRPDRAISLLRELLKAPRLQQTEYVVLRRDEIQQQLDRAERSRLAVGFAARFPGARFSESPDGTAELHWDFSDALLGTPAGRETLDLADGRTRVASLLLAEADRPGRGSRPAALSLRVDHVLQWIGRDATGGPRDAPLRVDCPFLPKRRIEVSFSCSSDQPSFLTVSVCGVAAGILSQTETLTGGRGVALWNAADLDRPDRAFDERTRATWLERNPDALRREADTAFFQFEPGRIHRVRVVKDTTRTQLWVDGRLRASSSEVRFQPGPLQNEVILLTWGPLDVDDLRIAGTLDPEWLRRK